MTPLLAILSLLASSVFAETASRPLRRYLLAAASNDGGADRTRLRFASDDARGIVSVMKSIGGVSEESSRLLLEPDTGRFLSALREMSGGMVQARDSGFRVEFMLYYSGHSDEDGLLLGSSRLSYSSLRKSIESSPAEIRLAVLDACASGAALRAKGGVRRQAFHIEGADRLRGQAYLTSSRAEEASQESDKLKGSFFTQAFLAGLRGAADGDGDRRITLLEAYRYAYQETVAKTTSTRTGPQHPEFDLDLSGSGDVVLTDLAQAAAVLELDSGLAGRIEIADSTGAVAADLEKAAGRKLSIGLVAGSWRIRGVDTIQQRIAHVELAAGTHRLFGWSATDSLAPLPRRPANPASRPDTSLIWIPVNLGFAPPISIDRDRGPRAWNGFSLDVFMSEAARIDGSQISGGYAHALRQTNGLQIAGGIARSGGLRGVQASMGSLVDGHLTGAQYGLFSAAGRGGIGHQAGVVDWVGGDFTGLQSAVAAMTTGNVTGVQATVAGWAGSVRGAQLSVLNIAGSVAGVQAGVVNLARSVHGSQVGVVNLAGLAQGAQIGVLNLADTLRGAVVGVVNLARDLEGFPLGLVSLGANMEPGLEARLEATGWGTALVRLDADRFHVKFAATGHLSDPLHRFGGGIGFGAHWKLDPAWKLDVDLLSRQILNLPEHGRLRAGQWNQVSVSVHRALGHADLFGGISYDVLAMNRSGDADHLANLPGEYQFDAHEQVRMWPGVFVGFGF